MYGSLLVFIPYADYIRCIERPQLMAARPPAPRPAARSTRRAASARLAHLLQHRQGLGPERTEEQRLLGVQRSTVYAWRAGDFPARLDAGTLER
jgi:hypothetical protein